MKYLKDGLLCLFQDVFVIFELLISKILWIKISSVEIFENGFQSPFQDLFQSYYEGGFIKSLI